MATNIEVQRVCMYCGKEFTAKTTTTKYCSHTCNSRAYKSNLKKLKVELNDIKTKEETTKPMEELKAKEFLNVRETAILIGCSRQTVYALINTGKLKGVNIKEKKTIVPRIEIDKLFEH